MFDKDNYQLVKDLKRDVEENIVKYEEILIYLHYSVKPEKFKAQKTELTKKFEVMSGRRSTVRTKGKEAVKAIEDEKEKKTGAEKFKGGQDGHWIPERRRKRGRQAV